jgi:quercetin dioxygenase-like cupin family protein
MIELAELDIRHHMAGGVYAKETRLEAGMRLAQHRHKFDHLGILASGVVVLEVDGAQQVLQAPACVVIGAHKHHLVRAVSDATWYCVWPDDVDDEAKQEAPEGDMQAMAEAMQ